MPETQEIAMQARMNNPAAILPEAMPAIQALQTAI